jgi:GABA permease
VQHARRHTTGGRAAACSASPPTAVATTAAAFHPGAGGRRRARWAPDRFTLRGLRNYAPGIVRREVVLVRRCLVVANQTLGGDQLLACVRERMGAGRCHFHVVVPATPADQLDPASVPESVKVASTPPPADHDRLHARTQLEDEVEEIHVDHPAEDLGRALARAHLREALKRLRELGAHVSGEVGVADPLEAVGVVLHRHEFDEVILSTLPERRSRWLAMDLPSRIQRTYKLPVTQVTGPPHVPEG